MVDEPTPLVKVKLLYFALFGAFGSISPLISLLYRENKLTSDQIGVLATIAPGIFAAFQRK